MKHTLLRRSIYAIVVAIVILLASKTLRAEVDLWPLLEINDRTQTICYPVYSKEGKFMLLMNAYARTNCGKDHHIFWPFIKLSEGRVERIAPFWFQPSDKKFILLPFYYRNKDFTLWTIPPVIINNSSHTQAVIPFYMKSLNSLFIFPNFYFSIDKGVTTTSFLPFFRKSSTYRQCAYNSLWLMPYYHQYSNDASYDYKAVYPFFSVENSPKNWHVWFANYYQSKSENESIFRFFPLFCTSKKQYAKNQPQQESTWVLWPFYQQEKSYDKKTGNIIKRHNHLFPFYSMTRKSFANNEPRKETMWILWPFYKREKVYEQQTGELANKTNHFLFFSNNLNYGKRSFSIFGKVIMEQM